MVIAAVMSRQEPVYVCCATARSVRAYILTKGVLGGQRGHFCLSSTREGGRGVNSPQGLPHSRVQATYIRRRCRARTISSPMPLSCTAAQCKTASRGHPHSRNAPMQCILFLGCERQTSRTLMTKKAHAPRPSQRPGGRCGVLNVKTQRLTTLVQQPSKQQAIHTDGVLFA